MRGADDDDRHTPLIDVSGDEAPDDSSPDVEVKRGNRSRLVLITASCFMTWLLSGGLVLGFGTLQEWLLFEGQYNELCTDINATCIASLATNGTCAVAKADGTCVNEGGACVLKLCGPQQRALELIFTYTYAGLNAASAIIGVMVDSIGPRVAAIFGLIMTMAGFLLLAYSDSETFDYFVIGFCLVGAGGIGPYFAHFNFSNLFRKYQGVYISAVTGLFNLAGLNFYWLFDVAGPGLLKQLNLSPETLRYNIFIIYTAVAGAGIFVALLLYPDKVYHDGDTCVLPVESCLSKGRRQPVPEVRREASKSVVAAAKVSLPSDPISDPRERSPISPGLDSLDDDSDFMESPGFTGRVPDEEGDDGKTSHEKPKISSLLLLKQSLKRAKFWWLLVWWSISNLMIAFVGGSFPNILEALNGTSAEVSWQTSILANLPLLVFNPIIGIFLEKHGFSFVFLCGNIVACACLALLFSPVYGIQVANLVVFSMQKAFLFTVTFAFLLLEFPIQIYGTLAATITAVAFGVGFLGTPLLSLVTLSKELISTPSLNGAYVLPASVLIAALLPCFFLSYSTRKVSDRQKRYRLQKRKTTISDVI